MDPNKILLHLVPEQILPVDWEVRMAKLSSFEAQVNVLRKQETISVGNFVSTPFEKDSQTVVVASKWSYTLASYIISLKAVDSFLQRFLKYEVYRTSGPSRAQFDRKIPPKVRPFGKDLLINAWISLKTRVHAVLRELCSHIEHRWHSMKAILVEHEFNTK